ncbi:unannotated protein [freshwater metagenome]|uniref:Unannotated protein n=1 Tax=freshwater metagenome TaxID=449393 RepID=A0A6J6IAU8_9ZZZZ
MERGQEHAESGLRNMATRSGRTVTDTDSGVWGEATATFSPDRIHRYSLTRVWDSRLPIVNFLMLNPSTADAFTLDPTNRRCVGFARDWGFGGLATTNIFAFRSTDPKGLRLAADPVGSENDRAILDAVRSAELVVAAWGTHGELFGRGRQVGAMVAETGVELHALRLTKAGHPGHPLYVSADSEPVAFTCVG